ncbi:tetratricopeptide repeat protein [Treponema sp.]|uniref:tetratricopeptide repeat protein n=1 Tax=Treponema sp. TaxID=166 RepID=UPI00298D7893|nr:tetratricopeptide repeat protein [Treponema sp.]MCQ2240471.1 tetratricopeptide repeat protein [Treponema sp.]
MEINRSLIRNIIRKLALLCLPFFAASNAFSVSSLETESFVQGLVSYKKGEWADASVYLRQSVNNAEYATDSNWYLIIMSEVYSGNYDAAISDCDFFIDNYSESQLLSCVEYQRGRAYHNVGLNDNAVMALSSFCNEYPDSDMYSSALFWIAECFYDDYDFETARALYERIVAEYPESPKRADAEFKLYLITQHDREQKLLYLLRMTGEEYLNSRENYEKQLRMMQTDDMTELRKQLRAANARILELESAGSVMASPVVPVPANVPEVSDIAEESPVVAEEENYSPVEVQTASAAQADEEMLSLKAKAALIQRLLNERNGEAK